MDAIDNPITTTPYCIEYLNPKPSRDGLRLILHIDVNKTIIASDKAENRSLDDTLNILLAERTKYRWSPEVPEPISYFDYVCDYVLPGNRHDGELKWQRRSITKNFVNFLLETNHPLAQDLSAKFNKIKETLQDNYVFPSFFRLIRKLREDEVDFRIILRSFGKDMPEVLETIKATMPNENFAPIGRFKHGQLHLPNHIIERVQDIYSYFKLKGDHLAIQDDWNEWNDHHEHLEYGKKFPLDLQDRNAISLFFDDNIDPNPESPTNIVSPINARDGSQIPIKILLERKILLATDTLQAILDEDYFVKAVEDALQINTQDSTCHCQQVIK